MNRIVVPGEKLCDFPNPIPFAFIENGKTYSSVIGLYNEGRRKLVPLQGCYIPKVGDQVVGIVEEVRFIGYTVEIRSPYGGFISSKECREELGMGDIILAKVKSVDEVKNVLLWEPRKLIGGELLEIIPVRVPRVIGKKSSMLNLLKRMTGSNIIVGRNGRVWLKGGDVALAIEAILKIEKEAHTSGLTDRMSRFLEKERSARS